jgi:hypothetical protein
MRYINLADLWESLRNYLSFGFGRARRNSNKFVPLPLPSSYSLQLIVFLPSFYNGHRHRPFLQQPPPMNACLNNGFQRFPSSEGVGGAF